MTAQRERERRERRERPIPRGVRLLCLRDDASRHRRNDASRRASPPSGEIGNGAGQVLGPAGRERGEGRVGRQGERASEREREDRALFRLEAGCLLCPTGPLCVARETGAREVFYLFRTPVACVTTWPATTLFSLLYILNQPITSFCCFFRED